LSADFTDLTSRYRLGDDGENGLHDKGGPRRVEPEQGADFKCNGSTCDASIRPIGASVKTALRLGQLRAMGE
jgi:hypothetical protein